MAAAVFVRSIGLAEDGRVAYLTITDAGKRLSQTYNAQFFTQLSFLALCAFVNRLGLTVSSGYGVASKIVNFAMLIPSALMQSMASFVAQNVGAGKQKRAKEAMLTGIGVGLIFGCAVFALVLLKGDVLASIFSPDTEVVQKGFEYLKGFAPETIVTAILFSMVGYFNRNTTRRYGSWLRELFKRSWCACRCRIT